MEIGNQIKNLRLRHGITQEAMAQHLGITPQAISKWERGVATPDIALLPDISAYFGVTIDELFALSDETRMERIQNMLWDVRFIPQTDIDSARQFLLEKARREQNNGRPHELLADMENHLAHEHLYRAEEYAKEALRRDPELREAHSELNIAMGGKNPDWNGCNHYLQIDYYKEFLYEHPDNWRAHMWLMDQLIDDYRLDEAEKYYRKAIDVQNAPRLVDPFEALAQYYEIKGDYLSAVHVLREELDVFDKEWHFTTGETADVVHRHIERLEKKLSNS